MLGVLKVIWAFLYDLHWAHGGSNSWEKPTVPLTKMEQCSATFISIGNPECWQFEGSFVR